MNHFVSYWPYYAIILAAVLGLLAAFFLPKWSMSLRLKKQGRSGEAKVAAILKNFAFSHGYRVINDISIPLYDGCTQIDHILIGEFGLLVVETKSHKGDIYAEPREKEWVQIVGGKKEKMYNPLLQNKTHVDALRYQLQKHEIYKVPIDSLVVFSGANKKNLYIEQGHPIMDIRLLKKYLNKNERYIRDNGVSVQKLYDFLKSIAVTDPKVLKQHNKDVAKRSK